MSNTLDEILGDVIEAYGSDRKHPNIEDTLLLGCLEHQIDIIEDAQFRAQDQLKQLRTDYYTLVNRILKDNRDV